MSMTDDFIANVNRAIAADKPAVLRGMAKRHAQWNFTWSNFCKREGKQELAWSFSAAHIMQSLGYLPRDGNLVLLFLKSKAPVVLNPVAECGQALKSLLANDPDWLAAYANREAEINPPELVPGSHQLRYMQLLRAVGA